MNVGAFTNPGAFFLVAVLAVGAARASTVSYADDRAGFIVATGATSIGALPASGGTGTVVGDVTFTNASGGVIAFSNFSNELAGNDLAVSGVENFNIAIAGGAYAFGFDLHEPAYTSITGCNATCFDTTFRIELFAGATSLGTFTYNAPNDASSAAGGPVGFFGVSSTIAFDRVQVRDLTNTIDNEFFGNFLTSTTTPEPATSPLVFLALATAVAVRARRSRGPR